MEYNNDTNSFTVDCEPSGLFRLQEYNIPGVIQSIIGWVCTIHMGRMILGWLVTTEREPPLHHCLPSKNLASPLPKAVNPRMEENCLSQFRVGDRRRCFLLPQIIKTRVLKVCFWFLGHPEMP